MHIIKSNIYSAKRIDDQLKDRHLEFFFTEKNRAGYIKYSQLES